MKLIQKDVWDREGIYIKHSLSTWKKKKIGKDSKKKKNY